MDVVTKRRAGAPPDLYAAEAAGLRWLGAAHAAGGVAVAEVAGVSPDHLDVVRVPEGPATRDAAVAFGRALALTHAAGADGFGAPPVVDGRSFAGQMFVGHLPMPSQPRPSWGAFYAGQRVAPFLPSARNHGALDAGEVAVVEAACALVAAGTFDDGAPAARLHGDLWNGNVLWSPQGVVLIDPAAHGGHPETDLAMLALFGCPHLADVLAAYDEAAPLREGRHERVPLHQLHPLAVHAADQGRGYGLALVDAARATLRLA